MKKRNSRNTPNKKKKRTKNLTASVSLQKDGLLYNALPWHGKMEITLNAAGFPEMIYPSRISFTPEMLERLVAVGQSYWHPRPEPITDFKYNWIMNTLADADQYPHALQDLDKALKDKPVPVYNHPYGILKTRRDYVWAQLLDVPNLIAPKCVRFQATSPNTFIRAFEKAGFEFPVIIRPTGSHTGHDMIKVDSKDDWPKIFSIPWGGLEMYMTQWTDFQSEAGEWRKLRLCLTKGRVTLRHILISDSWLIHAMDRDDHIVDRELEVLQSADDWKAIQRIGADVFDRIGLDYCGIDLGYKSESEFVLFEANPCMSILSRMAMPEYRRDEYEANLKKIEDQVWQSVEAFIANAR